MPPLNLAEHRSAGPALALGTVQLGLPYGIANTSGMPTEGDAVTLLRSAVEAGITVIDTARAYGDAERRIGLALSGIASDGITLVTKLDPLAAIGPEDGAAALQSAKASVDNSRTALHRDHLDVLLLHRAIHRTAWGGTLWRWLISERRAGRIGRLGVSVENPSDALGALADPAVEHIQLPFNVLDWRWENSGVITALIRRPDVTVHVRSVFLQGLLAGQVDGWPVLPKPKADVLTSQLEVLARSFGRQSVVDLSLAYVRAHDWIGAVVLGVETPAQLATNLALFRMPPLTSQECERVRGAIPPVPADLLDPSQWKRPADQTTRR